MKKISFALLALLASGSALAENVEFAAGEDALGEVTARSAIATTYDYTVAETREARLFVKNAFEFTLSANVIMAAGEEAAGRYMVVGTTNTQGRNFFVGHSNGGSVSACQDPWTASEAADSGESEYSAELSARVDFAAPTGCTAG